MPPALEINRKVAIRPLVVRRRIWRLMGAFFGTILVVALLAAAVYGGRIALKRALQHPDFVIRRIFIPNTGVRTVSDDEIKTLAGITPHMNIYATSLEPIARRLETHPDIRSVEVAKRHPDTLVVTIVEREPVAIIKGDASHPDIPIDRDGVMLSPRKMEHAEHLPRLSGLDQVAYKPGARLADARVPVAVKFADALLHIQQQDFLSVKSFRFNNPETIVMQTATIDEIRIGSDYSNEKMQRLIGVLDTLRAQRINARMIDLRFCHVAVIPFNL